MTSAPVIENVEVDPTLLNIRFQCDLKRCKGACCTIPGGRGAPLLDEEVEELRKALPVVWNSLGRNHQEVIERLGFYEGIPGDYVTTCVDHRACVFVVMEDGIARCSLEQAFLSGATQWRKPLSCHLFPIRFDRGLHKRVRFEYLDACTPAHALGASTRMNLSTFLKEALNRALGPSWTDQFTKLFNGGPGKTGVRP